VDRVLGVVKRRGWSGFGIGPFSTSRDIHIQVHALLIDCCYLFPYDSFDNSIYLVNSSESNLDSARKRWAIEQNVIVV
jgi:hypothetical protein